MQYILSEDEYKQLLKDAKDGKAITDSLPSKKELQQFATMVADNLVIKSGWMKGKVWGCLITKTKKNKSYEDEEYYLEWYCDDCPSQNICPYEYKSWSK